MILLTGGAGCIGSHTAAELMERGRDVIIADDFSNSSPRVIDRLERICGRRPAVFEADVSDHSAMEELFRREEIEAVIHFAGYKAVGESVQKPVQYYKNNLGCTLNLLELMAEHGVKSIIFSSSATVYGPEAIPPYTEDMRTGPCANPYGWSKLMSEEIIRGAATARPEMSAMLLRYFNPIGAHPSGLIGEDPSGIPNNLMPYITKVAVGKLERLNVFGDDYPTPDGTGVRDYIHVCDLAAGHAAALDWCETHTGADMVNLGTGRGYTVLEVVRAFEKASGIPIPYVIAPRRDGDIPVLLADTKKAERVLGWTAKHGIEDMCADSWRWQKCNPEGYATGY